MKSAQFNITVGLIFLLLAGGWSVRSYAMVEHRFARTYMSKDYLTNGIFTGGQSSTSSTSFSILGIRRIYAARQKIERVVIKLGDDKGHPLIDKVSYFHVAINDHLPRIEMDLSQTVASNVNEQKLKKIFLGSPYVKSAQINFDPTDMSMTIQLRLKKPVEAEVFELKRKNSAGKIVLDMKALSGRSARAS